MPSDEFDKHLFAGWLTGAPMGAGFSSAKVTALLAQCAQPELSDLLRIELREHGDGYLTAALSLAEVEQINFGECAKILQRTLTATPASVLSEFSCQQVNDVTAGLFRKLKPLTVPVRESYLDALDKMKHPGVLDFLAGLIVPTSVSWMVFEFPNWLLRPDVLAVVDLAFEARWPMDPQRPSYRFETLMDDIRDVALTLGDNVERQEAFLWSLSCVGHPTDAVRVVAGWREFAVSINIASQVLAMHQAR